MEINDELMRQWEPKVQRFASTTYIEGLDRDDLIQELRIAIVKAAQGLKKIEECCSIRTCILLW